MLTAVAVFSLVTEERNAEFFFQGYWHAVCQVSRRSLQSLSSKRNDCPVSTGSPAKQTEHCPPVLVM